LLACILPTVAEPTVRMTVAERPGGR
jgi:hypothetical protein